MKFRLCFLSLIFFFADASARYPVQEKESLLIQKMSGQIERMRHEISNHDAEIKILESKLLNIEDAVESLRNSLDEAHITQKEKNKEKECFQQLSNKNILSDIKHLQTYIEELQKNDQSQNKEIDHLKTALKSLMAAISISDIKTDESSFHTYKVQPGDSLGIIAQKYGVKLKEIKEINKLKNDVIFQGQTLKIPN